MNTRSTTRTPQKAEVPAESKEEPEGEPCGICYETGAPLVKLSCGCALMFCTKCVFHEPVQQCIAKREFMTIVCPVCRRAARPVEFANQKTCPFCDVKTCTGLNCPRIPFACRDCGTKIVYTERADIELSSNPGYAPPRLDPPSTQICVGGTLTDRTWTTTEMEQSHAVLVAFVWHKTQTCQVHFCKNRCGAYGTVAAMRLHHSDDYCAHNAMFLDNAHVLMNSWISRRYAVDANDDFQTPPRFSVDRVRIAELTSFVSMALRWIRLTHRPGINKPEPFANTVVTKLGCIALARSANQHGKIRNAAKVAMAAWPKRLCTNVERIAQTTDGKLVVRQVDAFVWTLTMLCGMFDTPRGHEFSNHAPNVMGMDLEAEIGAASKWAMRVGPARAAVLAQTYPQWRRRLATISQLAVGGSVHDEIAWVESVTGMSIRTGKIECVVHRVALSMVVRLCGISAVKQHIYLRSIFFAPTFDVVWTEIAGYLCVTLGSSLLTTLSTPINRSALFVKDSRIRECQERETQSEIELHSYDAIASIACPAAKHEYVPQRAGATDAESAAFHAHTHAAVVSGLIPQSDDAEENAILFSMSSQPRPQQVLGPPELLSPPVVGNDRRQARRDQQAVARRSRIAQARRNVVDLISLPEENPAASSHFESPI